ncbi:MULTISPECIES: GNAT family N-acetyltransferase [Streptosporangium]|uniref:GNAT family N-acetyltransferase n=1 Tax=Streptosporangium jomthongense TaxID=1193683 RepID=A0ABV8ES33_9ACTN
MRWTFTSDPEVYAGAAEQWLLREPVRNTIQLTMLRALREGLWSEDPLMGWAADPGGEIVAAALHAPPQLLMLADMPAETVRELATALIEAERPVLGVRGGVALAEVFAAAWWRPERTRRSERLYRLDTLTPPPVHPRGAPRTAGTQDLELLVAWGQAFQREAGGHSSGGLAAVLAGRVGRREILLWEVEGRPVAYAGASVPIGGVSRVGPVYTPPGERGRGYGTAVSHAVTARAREWGAAEVLLFTDLSNPVSNSIYRTIGYRPVADYASIVFG